MIRLFRSEGPLEGRIRLDGSKSESNRILILRALGDADFPIEGLSTSQDTTTMLGLLEQFKNGDFSTAFDCGAAGTTFRFMTAFLATRKGTQILTGSERMKQRPVGPLVEALRKIGADITYIGASGYPPLKIGPFLPIAGQNRIAIDAGMSSQYISALLMLGPFLSGGLQLELTGEVVSRPYIEMTLRQMNQLGLSSDWKERVIEVLPQQIWAHPYVVEADWSAASYHYALVAFAEKANLFLDGLSADSFQGDAVITKIMNAFGVETEFTGSGIRIMKTPREIAPVFEWDFLECPDLAQTIAVVCAGLGVKGRFTGLQTLRIKETDRILALQQELEKVQVDMLATNESETVFEICPQKDPLRRKAEWDNTPMFKTYEDHRMAMAFAPLGMMAPIIIEEPGVVQKSYPAFWDDLRTLGFELEALV